MDYRLEQLRFELREDPSSRSFFKLGEHLRREGEHVEAVEVLRTGLKYHPRYVAAWVSLGRALLADGQGAEAAGALDKALELDPGNAVAARTAGEAGIVNGEWIKAVKSFKLARGLSPQDDSLDERIAFVEEKLGERGELEAPETTVQPTDEPLPVVPDDLGAENPFVVQATGHTGVWSEANDVFDVAADQIPPPDSTTDKEISPSDPEPEPEPESAPEPVPDQIPVPTMTLARLAIEQGDLDLAEQTLLGVLASRPEHEEAASLLESLRMVRYTGADSPVRSEDPARAKIQKLRRWLDTVRLASERLGS